MPRLLMMVFCLVALPGGTLHAAAPSAHDPQFDSRAAWPKLTGKEYFLKQTWPKGRVYVWAKPGVSADVKARGSVVDAYDAGNWLEDGRPCTRLVLDETADILLPDAPAAYTVSFKKANQEHAPVTVRHITAGRNARWYSAGVKFHGNVWLQAGGAFGNHGGAVASGPGHAFFRNDNGDPKVSRSPGSHISQYVKMDKPGGSIEFLGAFSMTDEFQLFSGMFIVGADSRVEPGRNATPRIDKGATLVLLDGAWFGKLINQFEALDMDLSGTVQAGLPERPLTRGCTWGISFKNWNQTRFPVPAGTESDKEWNTRIAGMVWRNGAAVRTLAAPGSNARLRITWHGIVDTWAIHDGDRPERSKAHQEPPIMAAFNAIPRLIDVYIDKGVALDGVEFDRLHAGGLLVPDRSVPAAWKNVSFGPHCAAAGDALYQVVPPIGRNPRY